MLPQRYRSLTLAAWAVALLAIAWGQATAVGLAEAEWLRLDNGLQVILIPQRSTPLVASTVIIKAGARHEPPGLAGAAHFLEHLLFDGTTHRTQRELYAAIDRIGAYSNASTRADLAIFQLLVHRDHLAEGLDLQADMLFHSTLAPAQVEKERRVVIEEIGQTYDTPQAAADRFFTETVFAGTPYRRPVLGTPASIQGLSRQAVWDYYQTFYQPANMTLVLMGGVERDRVLPLVRTTFGLPGTDRPLPPAAHTKFRLTGRRVVGRRAEATRTYLTLAFNAPRPTDPDYPALATLVALLNAGPTSRLERLFRGEESPTVYTVEAGLSPTRDAPLLTISATLPSEENGPAIIQRLLEELERIASGHLSAEAVERATVEARAREVLLAENILYYAYGHAPILAAAPPEWVRSFPHRLERVTREEVVAALRRTVSGQPFLATLYGPSVAEGERSWEAVAPSREAEATPPPSTQAGARPVQAIVQRKLANGLTVVVKEAPDTEVFALHLLARDRALWEPEGKTGIAELMHRLLAEGTAHRSAEQIARELAAIGARLKVTDDPAIPYD
ncbi:MAG: insulinase family protein, partial [Nitrospinota bacterium]